ncbi:MAG: phosphatidate cytidylyltransferase [Sandaracinus sp.]|nr:phosphatidate cytidylyltransferase [Sandaracinus sp.]|tara:strand:+ start:421 stop:1275 length:855 start_codon:yes stop_codon:yes gene_type:complete
MSDATEPAPEKKKLGGTALRFVSALPVIAVVLYAMFWAPKWAFQLFGLLWLSICASELMAMTMPQNHGPRVWGILATVGFASVIIFAGGIPGAILAGIFGLAVGALIVGLVFPDPVPEAAKRIGWLMGGPVYIAGTLSSIVLLHHDTGAHGGAWVLLSMFYAFLSDTGAYFAGRTFGKHKLYPKLSPKKTVEGSIGGILAATLGGVAVQQTLLAGEIGLVPIIVLGVFASALGQAGDLFESLLKRSCGVKDSGNIMPGHGGLLDRSDALMFTGATTYFYVSFFH